ncbi:MAG: hypothetical protein HAW66_05440 [Shewanella sp.]|nr:hypothetical protein [Shewanella sp.]
MFDSVICKSSEPLSTHLSVLTKPLELFNGISNKGYRVCSKSISRGMHILTSSTQDVAYKIGIGATTGGLVGSVGGPITMVAGAAAGATVAATNEFIGAGSQWVLSHVLSEEKSAQAASFIKFTLGISATYLATESVISAVASVGLGFASKKVSDTLVPKQSVNPVIKGAVDATFGAVGCLVGHGVGQKISNVSNSSHVGAGRAVRQVEPFNCSNGSEPINITSHQNLNGTQGECGHYQVTGHDARLTITDEAGYRSKIALSKSATVISEDNSTKGAVISNVYEYEHIKFDDNAGQDITVNQKSYFDTVVFKGHAGQGGEIIQDGLFEHVHALDEALEDVEVNQNSWYDYVELSEHAGLNAKVNEGGHKDIDDSNGFAGENSTFNLQGSNNIVGFHDSAGLRGRITLSGKGNGGHFYGDSVRESNIRLEGFKASAHLSGNAGYKAEITSDRSSLLRMDSTSGNHSKVTAINGARVILSQKSVAHARLISTNMSMMDIHNSAGFKANMLAHNNGRLLAYDLSGKFCHARVGEYGALETHNGAFFQADITVKTNASFAAFNESCSECNVMANGGTVWISDPTAFLNATVLICNDAKIYNAQGQLLTQENFYNSTLIKSFINRNSINTDELCQPISDGLITDDNRLLALILSIPFVIVVTTSTGIFLYIKKDKVKQCHLVCREKGYRVVQNNDHPIVTYTRTEDGDGQVQECVSVIIEPLPQGRANASNRGAAEADLNAGVISVELSQLEGHGTVEHFEGKSTRTDDETTPLIGEQILTHEKGAKLWV